MESEWAKIGMENKNQNKLFTSAIRIGVEMNCIVIDVLTLSCNQNR